jgi:hypothetical protein
MTTTDDHQARLAAIKAEYAPYDRFPEFEESFAAHAKRQYRNPYEGVPAQAWDRGLEAAARFADGDDPRVALEHGGGRGLPWLRQMLAQR